MRCWPSPPGGGAEAPPRPVRDESLEKVRFSPGLWGSLSQGGGPLCAADLPQAPGQPGGRQLPQVFGQPAVLALCLPQGQKGRGGVPLSGPAGQKAHEGQAQAEKEGAGVDACAEPTANLLAALFKELACDESRPVALERFGYFLGRWVYLIDAADDLAEDLRRAPLTPFIPRWASPARRSSLKRSARRRTEACNQALNATAAQMLAGFQPAGPAGFRPHFGERGDKGPAGNPAGNLVFAHPREEKEAPRAGGPALNGPFRKFRHFGACTGQPLLV